MTATTVMPDTAVEALAKQWCTDDGNDPNILAMDIHMAEAMLRTPSGTVKLIAPYFKPLWMYYAPAVRTLMQRVPLVIGTPGAHSSQ